MIRFKTLAQFHRYRGLAQPLHPLISVVNLADVKQNSQPEPDSMLFDFYMIGLKHEFYAKVKYGQQSFDYDSGVIGFQAPGQMIRVEPHVEIPLKPSGWLIMFHPDFLRNTALSSKIKHYEFFDYAVNEALFLSEKEETMIAQIVANRSL
jgi:AraC family transcriptional activator of pobA